MPAPALRAARRGGRALLAAAALGAVLASWWLREGGHRAWAGPADKGGDRAAASRTAEGQSRRRLLEGTAAASVAAWAAAPEEADAFRGDRIQNAKATYVPKIRRFYQELFGYRDDIYLQVELKKGDAASRVFYQTRPAEWSAGADSKFDGEIAFATDAQGFENSDVGFGCASYKGVEGKVVFIKRGKCPFSDKMMFAKEAGAKAVVVYDTKIAKMDIRTSNIGVSRSLAVSVRSQGDALSGANIFTPREQGVTEMAVDKGKDAPTLEAVMMSLVNGTEVSQAFEAGAQPRVLDVKRFDRVSAGIDEFIQQKKLKKMLNEMEVYGNTMREAKDDFSDPIIKELKKLREAFGAAVREKDLPKARISFKAWYDKLDPLGQYQLLELV
ncbi:unnamed protein product [Prorocentrum cordatum]|uniref:PA domain-containing protein n=1 Tax=Prorocentrum cordatum TaxID=2364126 RepID=A0ABN9UXA6_9DINO|nr:unnamed protein product [Polarella glacialis]